jgi:hypothetical protein
VLCYHSMMEVELEEGIRARLNVFYILKQCMKGNFGTLLIDHSLINDDVY